MCTSLLMHVTKRCRNEILGKENGEKPRFFGEGGNCPFVIQSKHCSSRNILGFMNWTIVGFESLGRDQIKIFIDLWVNCNNLKQNLASKLCWRTNMAILCFFKNQLHTEKEKVYSVQDISSRGRLFSFSFSKADTGNRLLKRFQTLNRVYNT